MSEPSQGVGARPLDGRVAVVVGASRGLGKGAAVELGAAGAVVYVAGRTVDAGSGGLGSLAGTVADITALGGTAVPVRCDVTLDADVAALFERVRTERGRLDVLVNSVFNTPDFGTSIGSRFWELPVGAWDDVVALGTRSAYTASWYAAPLLIGSGGGLIVNVSGRGAERYRYNVPYGVGKAALDRITKDTAQDLRDEGVAVVSVWPNMTATEHLVSSRGEEETAGLETPRYTGRAVVALAADPQVMERSGRRFWVAELGRDYGLTDEHGRTHELPE